MKDLHASLSIIQQSLQEALSVSVEPSFLQVCQQIPMQPDYQIDFSNYRLSSHTLGKSILSETDLHPLVQAHDLLMRGHVDFQKTADLFLLNQTILSATSPQMRTEILNEPYAFPHPEQINQGLLLLQDFYKNSLAHPLVKRVAFVQGLLSLHPFSDGNHRTCRLILDTSLCQLNYPPTTVRKTSDLIFANPVDQMNFPLAFAVQAVLHGIGETLSVLK